MSDLIETKDSLIQNAISDIETVNKVIKQDNENNHEYVSKLESAAKSEQYVIEGLIDYTLQDYDSYHNELIEAYRAVVADNIQRNRDRMEYVAKVNDLIIDANNSTIKILENALSNKENISHYDALSYRLAYLSNLCKNTDNQEILDDIKLVVDALIREFVNEQFGDILNIHTDE